MQTGIDPKLKHELEALISRSRRIVFFGGAGVSTESGIPDFRSAKGLYSRRSPVDDPPAETILSHHFLLDHPREFFQFYRGSILHPNALPNPAHVRLARLEAEGKLLAVVTQNIDGLHQAAGSKRVLELHGSVHRNTCLACRKPYDLAAVLAVPGVPYCACGGLIRPDVVLYEESLDEAVVRQAIQAISQADLLIVGGTSLTVYPAAGLVTGYRQGMLVIINQSPTPLDDKAHLVIRAPIGAALAEPQQKEEDET